MTIITLNKRKKIIYIREMRIKKNFLNPTSNMQIIRTLKKMLNRFFLVFIQRTHRTYMQTSMLNVLICRKSSRKNFPEY